MTSRAGIRIVQVGAICAIVLVSALFAAAKGNDGSSGKTASTKSKAAGQSTAADKAKSGVHKTSAKRRRKSRVRGQMKIDSERALEIQEALIREHYLKGEATGKWNDATEEALRRYQAENGWQSKTVPDSRALIKLGLGPSKDNLLNPESAMTTVPDAPHSQAASPSSHAAMPTSESPAPAAPPTTPASNTSSGPQ